jgi:ABC-2 family transporter protein
MTFLPIVGRELRVAARRRGTWRCRFWAALLAILTAGWILLITTQPNTRPAQLGQSLFDALSWFAFLYCLVAGMGVTADCLSAEKREGTIGLLFLTDLRGYDVVFGKLTATSMNSVYGLLAILPVLGLPLLLGGVEPQAFWRTALALVNTLFLSLAAGMFVSSICRNERKAMFGTLMLILFLAGGLPAPLYLATAFGPPRAHPVFFLLLLPSPLYAFHLAAASRLFTPNLAARYTLSMISVAVMAWGFLFLASAVLSRTWQERAERQAVLRWRARWQRWCQGEEALRRRTRQRWLEINPLLWLGARDRFKLDLVWSALGALGLVWVWGYARYRRDWLSLESGLATAFVVHAVLKLWLASESSRRFVDDRRSGALEVLLSTPLTVEEILRGELLSLRRQFGRPILAVLVADICLLLVGMRDNRVSPSDRHDELIIYLALMFSLVADGWALAWVGMWQGLNARTVNHAILTSVFCILALPWGVLLVAATLITEFNLDARLDLSAGTLVLAVLALFTLVDAGFWFWAAHRLHTRFRVAATLRFQPRESRGGWWPFRPHRSSA